MTWRENTSNFTARVIYTKISTPISHISFKSNRDMEPLRTNFAHDIGVMNLLGLEIHIRQKVARTNSGSHGCVSILLPPLNRFSWKEGRFRKKERKKKNFRGSNEGPRDSFDLGMLFGSPPGIELGTFGGWAPGRPERKKKMQIGALSGDRTGLRWMSTFRLTATSRP